LQGDIQLNLRIQPREFGEGGCEHTLLPKEERGGEPDRPRHLPSTASSTDFLCRFKLRQDIDARSKYVWPISVGCAPCEFV
jgi:hypothetical protein